MVGDAWRSSASCAVGAIWWLYYDRQALVVLTGSTRSVVIYSYAHLPLLMSLAALSAGIRLAIEESGHDHLAAGAAVALCGGRRGVPGRADRDPGAHRDRARSRLGLALKLSTAIVVLLLLVLQPVAAPALLVGLVALALVVLVYLQRTYVDPANPGSVLQVRPEQGELGRAEPVAGGLGLVPVRVQERRRRDLVEPRDLVRA